MYYGKEYIWLVIFVGEENWDDMVYFYKFIIGIDLEFLREDFCLFMVYIYIYYDI